MGGGEQDSPHSEELGLDPEEWQAFRGEAHAALDEMIDYLKDVGARKVWRPLPDEVRARLRTSYPEKPLGLAATLEEFRRDVLPYPTGNIHPRFWSWVCGSGSPVGMLADLLASGMNCLTLGFDDSSAAQVELQVLDWFKELFGFPQRSSGLLVSGGSLANLVSVAVGQTAKCGYDIRTLGLNPPGRPRLVAYASTATSEGVGTRGDRLGSLPQDPCG